MQYLCLEKDELKYKMKIKIKKHSKPKTTIAKAADYEICPIT